MRHISFVVVSSLCATAALAQPRPIHRNPAPPPTAPAAPPPGRGMPPPSPPGQAGKERRGEVPKMIICRSQQSLLAQEQRRLDDARSDLAGTESELTQLRRRLEYLEARRTELNRQIGKSEATVQTAQTNYRRDCQADETCEQYESLAGQLDQQSRPLETELEDITREISATQGVMNDLRRRIDPLRSEYQSRRCNALVAGETAQDTIDRCTAIFSEWNRLQSQVNSLNGRLSQLRQRQSVVASALDNTQRRAQDYDNYLSSKCRGSRQAGLPDKYRLVRERALKLGTELDQMLDEVGRLRGMTLQ